MVVYKKIYLEAHTNCVILYLRLTVAVGIISKWN